MSGGDITPPYQVLRAKTERLNIAGHVEYEIADGVEVWARGLYSKVNTSNISPQNRKMQIYGTINNLLNQAPPLPAINNNAWYDLLGQSFRVGFRFDI